MIRVAASAAWLCGVTLSCAMALAELPVREVEAHRLADGSAIEAVAVAQPDERFPTIEARCLSSRRSAERRARDSLHRYVERASGSVLSAAQQARAHSAVDAHAQVVEVRGLVDGGSVVRVQLASSVLERAVGAEVPWP